jgi:hypothetical protein
MNEERFLEFLREILEKETQQGTIRVPNLNRIREMNATFRSVSKLLSMYQVDAKVECGIDDLSKAGYISIHFPSSFETSDLVRFAECFSAANNIEINTTFKNLNVGMMFYGVFQSELMR